VTSSEWYKPIRCLSSCHYFSRMNKISSRIHDIALQSKVLITGSIYHITVTRTVRCHISRNEAISRTIVPFLYPYISRQGHKSRFFVLYSRTSGFSGQLWFLQLSVIQGWCNSPIGDRNTEGFTCQPRSTPTTDVKLSGSEYLRTLNLIVKPCIFVESLQFINQRVHV